MKGIGKAPLHHICISTAGIPFYNDSLIAICHSTISLSSTMEPSSYLSDAQQLQFNSTKITKREQQYQQQQQNQDQNQNYASQTYDPSHVAPLW